MPELTRTTARNLIIDAIGDRSLVWMGISGTHAGRLVELPQFSHCYSMYSPLEAQGVESVALESLLGERRHFDLREFIRPEARPMVTSLVTALQDRALLVASEPFEFFSMLPASARASYLGTSMELFDAVSDKATVEAELGAMPGVETIPWRRLEPGPDRLSLIQAALQEGPITLRSSSRQTGGQGHNLIREPADLETSVIAYLDEPISVAPFLAGYVPVCVAGCVFQDGVVTLHTPSVMLVGIPGCTPYELGWCGNDFGAVRALGKKAFEGLEACARAAGSWLHARGFVGVFGIDTLVHDDRVVFVEINARFLGSSRVSGEIDAEMDSPGVYFDHLMAWLGQPSHVSRPLMEQAMSQSPRSQIVCYNLQPEPVTRRRPIEPPAGFATGFVPDAAMRIWPREALGVLETGASVTEDGMSVNADARKAIGALTAAFSPVGQVSG